MDELSDHPEMPTEVSIEGQMDRVCEQFEAAWQAGTRPQIGEYLKEWRDTERQTLFQTLLLIDLDYRWRRALDSGTGRPDLDSAAKDKPLPPLPAQPRLEDYLACYPEFGNIDRLPIEVVVEEYRSRLRWKDFPRRSEYAARFPDLEYDLLAFLASAEQSMCDDAPHFKARVYHNRQLVFESGIVGPVEFGRQRVGEPDPYVRTFPISGMRVIIAGVHQTKFARSHVSLDFAKGAARVKNNRSAGSIVLDPGGRLAAGRSVEIEIPVLLVLGETVIRLEPPETGNKAARLR
jgi:hypothetical protein